jgi:hypothetical protein
MNALRDLLTPMKGVQTLMVQPASGAVLAWAWKYWDPEAKVGLPATFCACAQSTYGLHFAIVTVNLFRRVGYTCPFVTADNNCYEGTGYQACLFQYISRYGKLRHAALARRPCARAACTTGAATTWLKMQNDVHA